MVTTVLGGGQIKVISVLKLDSRGELVKSKFPKGGLEDVRLVTSWC